MSKKVRIADLPEFDFAEHLRSDEDIAEYLRLVLEEGDADEWAHALGLVARARGMTQIAEASGLAREALYRALRPGARPRFDTVARVCAALGLHLTITPARATKPAARRSRKKAA
jgi:probable addiction module antidote protein